MKKKLNAFRKSVLFSWFISYLSILMIPITISGIVYFQSLQIVKSQVVSMNDSMIRQLQQELDGQIQNIEKISLQIAMNPKLEELMDSQSADKGVIDFSYFQKIKQLFQDFNIYTLSNNYIQDFYVYLHDRDVVLTSNSYYDSRSFYDLNLKNTDGTYEAWQEKIIGRYYGNFILMHSPKLSADSEDTMALMRSLPVQAEKFNTTLVIFIDQSQLQRLVQNINWKKQNQFLIINKNNEVMFSTQYTVLPEFMRYDNMKENSGLLYGNLDGTNVAVSYIESQIEDWKYITITKTSVFNEKVELIRRLTIISLLLCIFIGGMIAFWFTKKNYNPLHELVGNIAGKIGASGNRSENEYRYLDNLFTTTLQEKQQSDRKLEQQNAALRTDYLNRIMKGKLGGAMPPEEVLSSYGIEMMEPFFAVILIYIDDYSGFLGERAQENNESLHLVRFIIKNISEELIAREHSGFVTEIDDLMACLIGMKRKPDEAELESIFMEVQQIIREKFSIYFTVSISDVHQSMASVSAAYSEALEAMEYKLLKGKNGIIRYEMIRKAETAVGNYHYSLEMEQRMINCIKSGDFEHVKELVDKIFADNFSTGFLSIEMAKCLMFDLVSTMIKTVNEISNLLDPDFLEELHLIDRLVRCNSIEEMWDHMTDILKVVCGIILEKKRGQNQNKLRDSLIHFIEQHYPDEKLDLSMIAESVELSPKYVSAFFKQATGDGINSYINKVRLQHAKCLLLKDSLSIGEIARKVGFYNSGALIRVFNKYEGITPGQYREIGLQEGANGG